MIVRKWHNEGFDGILVIIPNIIFAKELDKILRFSPLPCCVIFGRKIPVRIFSCQSDDLQFCSDSIIIVQILEFLKIKNSQKHPFIRKNSNF